MAVLILTGSVINACRLVWNIRFFAFNRWPLAFSKDILRWSWRHITSHGVIKSAILEAPYCILLFPQKAKDIKWIDKKVFENDALTISGHYKSATYVALKKLEKTKQTTARNSQFALTYISKPGYYGNVKWREERVDM